MRGPHSHRAGVESGVGAIELLSHEGCPRVEATRALLSECLAEVGIAAYVKERIGPYPSPTVLINGHDVMGDSGVPKGAAACRVDAPTRERVLRALLEADRQGHP